MDLIGCKFDKFYLLGFSEKLLLPLHLPHEQIFFMEHARIDNWFYKNPWRRLYYFFAQSCQVISVSELMRRSLLGSKDNKKYRIKIIPNGINLDFFQTKKTLNFAEKTVKITTIARLSLDKGILEFVDFIKGLVTSGETIQATIIGKGPLTEQVITKIKSLNLENNIVIKSDLNQEEIRYELQNSDLFCLFSTKIDPFALVVAEAMSCGSEVLVSDKCGIVEYSKMIHSFNPTDIDLACRIYAEIKSRPQSPEKLHQEALNKFDENKMLKEYLATLQV